MIWWILSIGIAIKSVISTGGVNEWTLIACALFVIAGYMHEILASRKKTVHKS